MRQTRCGSNRVRSRYRLELLEPRCYLAADTIGWLSDLGEPTLDESPAKQSYFSSDVYPALAVAASSVAEDSIADRIYNPSGYEAFKAAALGPSVSPVFPLAMQRDLVVTSTELVGPDLTAVVLKPRSSSIVYQIPRPTTGAAAFEFLQLHIANAISAGSGRIVFPADEVFELSPPDAEDQLAVGPYDQKAHLTLSGLHDTEIDLNGSTLNFTNRSLGIRIADSSRIVIRNGTIHGSGVLSTIAKVMPDDTAAAIRFEVLPPYRALLESTFGNTPPMRTVASAEMSPGGGWRLDTTQYGELFTNRGNATNNFRYESGSYIATSGLLRNQNPFTANRDFVWLLHQSNSGHAILLDNTTELSDVTLEDLKFVNIPGMVVTGELDRGLHVNRIRLEIDPSLSGLTAASSDGIHINANGGDIVIENSTFGPNGDDKITIKGNYWKVATLDRNAKTITVIPVDRGSSLSRWGASGDKVVFIDTNFGVLGTARLSTHSVRNANDRHTFKLDSIPNNIAVNSIVGNVDRSGGRVVIRNNSFSETRAQGVLVQSNHVVVENNSFTGIAGPPIKLNLAQELWYEAINTNNVLIKNNTFERSSFSATKPAELIHLRQVNGRGDIIEIVDDVRIVGNRLIATPLPPEYPPDVPSDPDGPIFRTRLTYVNKQTKVSSQKIEAQIEVINDGTATVDFKDVSIRYYMTADGLTPRVSIRSTNAPAGSVVGSYHGDGGYVQLQMQKPMMVVPGTRLQIRFLITNAEGRSFNQANDPSFIATQTKVAVTDRMDVDFPGAAGSPGPHPDPGPNPSPSPHPLPGPTPADPQVSLVYLHKSPLVLTSAIEGQVELFNRSASNRSFNDVEVRYYLTPEDGAPSIAIVSASFPLSAMDSEYMTGGYVSFKIKSDVLVAAGDRLKFRFLISDPQNQTFDQSNDTSFVPGKPTRAETTAIDVWYQGRQLWGQSGGLTALASSTTSSPNSILAYDVNDDGAITPADALRVINRLSRSRTNTDRSVVSAGESSFGDVNGDGLLTALDALLIINYLSAANRAGVSRQLSEVDSVFTELALASPPMVLDPQFPASFGTRPHEVPSTLM